MFHIPSTKIKNLYSLMAKYHNQSKLIYYIILNEQANNRYSNTSCIYVDIYI